MFQNIGTQTSKGSRLVRITSTLLTGVGIVGIMSFRDSRATSAGLFAWSYQLMV